MEIDSLLVTDAKLVIQASKPALRSGLARVQAKNLWGSGPWLKIAPTLERPSLLQNQKSPSLDTVS